MNDDNVVPFDPLARGGMARRGAPDKNGPSPAEAVVLECPSCFARLHLATAWIEDETELLCGRCDTEIPSVSQRESGAV